MTDFGQLVIYFYFCLYCLAMKRCLYRLYVPYIIEYIYYRALFCMCTRNCWRASENRVISFPISEAEFRSFVQQLVEGIGFSTGSR